MIKKFSLEISTATIISILLLFVHIKVARPMLLAERFWEGAGYIQIVFTAFYGAYIAHKMKNPKLVPVWRIRIWSLFSIVFFSQLFLGLIGFETFLMTGTLHFPFPALIISGPLYRGEIGFMLMFFISTILLSGPAWCSSICYFGALDGIAAQKRKPGYISYLWHKKLIGLSIIISITLILRLSALSIEFASAIAILFGIGGLSVIYLRSRKKGTMVHCTTYCPIGTIVSFTKFLSPFRMYIDTTCTQCMQCTSSCTYQALTSQDIRNLKPGLTCTYCGDCLQACHNSSIKYKLWKFSPNIARAVFICITVSLHASCLVLARI